MSRLKHINLTFRKDQVIVVGEGAQTQIFTVVENFDGNDQQRKIKASLLKETQRVDGKVLFTIDKLVYVYVADKPQRVFDVEVIPTKGRGRTQVPKQIQFNENQLERVVKEIKGRQPSTQLQFNQQSSPEKAGGGKNLKIHGILLLQGQHKQKITVRLQEKY